MRSLSPNRINYGLPAVLAALLVFCLAVPAQAETIVDLRATGSTATINGAIFSTNDTQPVGTGHDEFLGVISNDPQVEGYNTDGSFEFDQQPGAHTESLLFTSLALINGTHYGFLLDIDQEGGDPLLSLDRLQIYLANAPDLDTGFVSGGATPSNALPGSQTTGFLANSILVYNMDAGPDGQNNLVLNFDNGLITGPGGSGVADMMVLIPANLFVQTNIYPYVYLYSRFGDTSHATLCLNDDKDQTTDCQNNDGPEHWMALTDGGPEDDNVEDEEDDDIVPEPALLFLFGSGLAAAGARLRNRHA